MSLENKLFVSALILAFLLTLFLSYKRRDVFVDYHKGILKYKLKIYTLFTLLFTIPIYILMLIIAGIHWIELSILLAIIVGSIVVLYLMFMEELKNKNKR